MFLKKSDWEDEEDEVSFRFLIAHKTIAPTLLLICVQLFSLNEFVFLHCCCNLSFICCKTVVVIPQNNFMYWYIIVCIDAYCRICVFLVKLIIHVSMQKSCVSMHVIITLVCIDAWCVCVDTQVVSISHVSMQGSCGSMHRVFCLSCIDAWLVCIDAYWTKMFCDLSHAVCIDAEAYVLMHTDIKCILIVILREVSM